MKPCKLSLISLLFLSGCGMFISNDDFKALHEHPECNSEYSFTHNSKAMFFGAFDESELVCVKKKKEYENSPEGKRAAATEEERRRGLQQKIKEYRLVQADVMLCNTLGMDLAARKGVHFERAELLERRTSKSNPLFCGTTLTSGFESRYYRITLDPATHKYEYE